jgi:high affinity Mn2+ porin
LENTEPNGDTLDLDFLKERADTAELEYRYGLNEHSGKVRIDVFMNHADMGNYSDALAQAAGSGHQPVVDDTHAERVKWGLGLDAEQEAAQDLGFFARLGWQDGNEETWTFTAIDQTAQVGFLLHGDRWGRTDDQLGWGMAVNGLCASHRAYLAAGGLDFIIGDGALNYAPEGIMEIFYNFHPIHEIGLSPDFQYVVDPAYNQDRGPVVIYGFRAHVEL